MPTDLDVSTAAWGTQNLLIASGDPITGVTGSAWASQVAENTGWLHHQPRNVASLSHHFLDPAETLTVGYVWLTAGTYSIYGHLGVPTIYHGATGTVSWDGTAIVTFDGADGTFTGSLCGWTLATAAWIAVGFSGSECIASASCAIRFGSYAP